MWLVEGQSHRLFRSPKLEMWVVNVRSDLLTAAERAEIMAQPSRMLPGDELIDLDRLMSQVAQDSDEPGTYNSGIAYALRRALRASRSCAPAHVKLMHPAVTRALMLLRQSGASFSLSRLAEESGIAPSYLSRLLVEHTNRSFVDWRNRIRLERFFEDYRPGANLLRASLDAGFGSYARFHHIFTELVGCTPSEWSSRAEPLSPMTDESHPVVSGGAPPPPNLRIRQRWMRLVPVVSPALAGFFGGNFIGRLLDAGPVNGRIADNAERDFPAAMSAEDVEGFIGTLRSMDAELGDDFEDLIRAHDFGGLYAGVLQAYARNPRNLTDAVTALTVLLWVALTGTPDPSFEQVDAAHQQIGALLRASLSRDPNDARAIHIALQCHFVVVYQALQAARASGDERALVQLRASVTSLAKQLLGEGIFSARLTNAGFQREPEAARASLH